MASGYEWLVVLDATPPVDAATGALGDGGLDHEAQVAEAEVLAAEAEARAARARVDALRAAGGRPSRTA